MIFYETSDTAENQASFEEIRKLRQKIDIQEKKNENYETLISLKNNQISLLEKKISSFVIHRKKDVKMLEEQELTMKKLKEENSRLEVEREKLKKRNLILRNDRLKEKWSELRLIRDVRLNSFSVQGLE